jgi:hypothetical protein
MCSKVLYADPADSTPFTLSLMLQDDFGELVRACLCCVSLFVADQ